MKPQTKGGHARAAVLSPERRKQIASDAAKARWNAVAFVNRFAKALDEAFRIRKPKKRRKEAA